VLAEKIQALEAAGRTMDLVSVTSQHSLQEIAVHAIVIDDKNFNHASAQRTVCITKPVIGERSMGIAASKAKGVNRRTLLLSLQA
jgi:hypothetical protein